MRMTAKVQEGTGHGIRQKQYPIKDFHSKRYANTSLGSNASLLLRRWNTATRTGVVKEAAGKKSVNKTTLCLLSRKWSTRSFRIIKWRLRIWRSRSHGSSLKRRKEEEYVTSLMWSSFWKRFDRLRVSRVVGRGSRVCSGNETLASPVVGEEFKEIIEYAGQWVTRSSRRECSVNN